MKKNFFKAITIGLTEKTAIVIRILFIIFIISLPLFIAVMFVGGGFWGFMLAIFFWTIEIILYNLYYHAINATKYAEEHNVSIEVAWEKTRPIDTDDYY